MTDPLRYDRAVASENREPMTHVCDLSVVVVNYNSAGFVEAFLHSLWNDPFTVDGRPGTVEVVIVDNASRREDHLHLESLRGDRVRLLRNPENLGYALANNQGFHITTGRFHLVSNPDVLIQPGCLQALIDALLSGESVGLVGPLATMDPEGSVYMPPNELPSPFSESVTTAARYEDAIARFHVRRRARFAHRYWTATEPFAMEMLSGGFFMGLRSTLLEHGLFDPAYPLYYEDTDLFRRYLIAGKTLLHVPQARIVHHFSRSAIPVIKAALFRNAIGARRYFRKFFGRHGERTFRLAHERAESKAADRTCPWPLEELRAGQVPPVLEIPKDENLYLEVSGNPKFSLTVGIFPPAGSYQFARGFWEPLPNTSYWVRLASAETGDTIRAWRIDKCLT
ncbi:MAG TPA: glycosyltransferase family 2 protein [Planctomycetota bacterium]|jgi:GT2 family glycosyltransferase|nr:glycosyltransferase family 2 protein [Planctomycetota bacterium]